MHMQVSRIIVGIYLIRLELSFLYLSIGTTFTTNNNETNNTALILQNTEKIGLYISFSKQYINNIQYKKSVIQQNIA